MIVTRVEIMEEMSRIRFSRRFGGLSLKTIEGRFLGFGLQNLVGVAAGMGGGTWRHLEAYVEAKQSREGPMAIRCTNIELDHFASKLNGSAKISILRLSSKLDGCS